MRFAPLILAFATVSATVSAQVGARGMMTGTPRTSSPNPAGVAVRQVMSFLPRYWPEFALAPTRKVTGPAAVIRNGPLLLAARYDSPSTM